MLIDDEYIGIVANDNDEAEIELSDDANVGKLGFIETPDERVGCRRVILVV